MANSKQYGYYIEGNKIAIVEKDVAFDNDPNSKDYGPGANTSRWKSPLSDVTDGLEIQYTYAPIYRVIAGGEVNEIGAAGTHSLGGNFSFFGYTSKEGYLAFVRAEQDGGFLDFSLSGYNEEFVVDSHILVSGSSRWNGLHTIKSRESDGGMIVTNTPFRGELSYTGNMVLDNTNKKIAGYTVSDDDVSIDYIFGTDSSITQYAIGVDLADTASKQIWKVTRTASGELTISKDIGWYAGEWSETDSSVADESNDACTIYKVIKDNLIVYPNNGITILQDESFEIDLPIYLQKALIYYIKSKMFEDLGDIKTKEYFHAQFLKQVERHNNGRTSGLRIVAPGQGSII